MSTLYKQMLEPNIGPRQQSPQKMLTAASHRRYKQPRDFCSSLTTSCNSLAPNRDHNGPSTMAFLRQLFARAIDGGSTETGDKCSPYKQRQFSFGDCDVDVELGVDDAAGCDCCATIISAAANVPSSTVGDNNGIIASGAIDGKRQNLALSTSKIEQQLLEDNNNNNNPTNYNDNDDNDYNGANLLPLLLSPSTSTAADEEEEGNLSSSSDSFMATACASANSLLCGSSRRRKKKLRSGSLLELSRNNNNGNNKRQRKHGFAPPQLLPLHHHQQQQQQCHAEKNRRRRPFVVQSAPIVGTLSLGSFPTTSAAATSSGVDDGGDGTNILYRRKKRSSSHPPSASNFCDKLLLQLSEDDEVVSSVADDGDDDDNEASKSAHRQRQNPSAAGSTSRPDTATAQKRCQRSQTQWASWHHDDDDDDNDDEEEDDNNEDLDEEECKIIEEPLFRKRSISLDEKKPSDFASFAQTDQRKDNTDQHHLLPKASNPQKQTILRSSPYLASSVQQKSSLFAAYNASRPRLIKRAESQQHQPGLFSGGRSVFARRSIHSLMHQRSAERQELLRDDALKVPYTQQQQQQQHQMGNTSPSVNFNRIWRRLLTTPIPASSSFSAGQQRHQQQKHLRQQRPLQRQCQVDGANNANHSHHNHHQCQQQKEGGLICPSSTGTDAFCFASSSSQHHFCRPLPRPMFFPSPLELMRQQQISSSRCQRPLSMGRPSPTHKNSAGGGGGVKASATTMLFPISAVNQQKTETTASADHGSAINAIMSTTNQQQQ